jgi:hypothetical protein
MNKTIAIPILAAVFFSLPRGSEAGEKSQTQFHSEDEKGNQEIGSRAK